MASDSSTIAAWQRLTAWVRARRRRTRLPRRWPIDRFRRLFALVLLALGVVLAVAPQQASAGSTRPAVVAGHDLSAGSRLGASDVRLVDVPTATASDGMLSDVGQATGRRLSGDVRSGEPLTDVRLVRKDRDFGRPGMSAVPIRLDDSAVADILEAGMKVDVVTAGDAANEHDKKTVIATNATVVAVTGGQDHIAPGQSRGRLVIIAVDDRDARFVASTSLQKPVTVTLR